MLVRVLNTPVNSLLRTPELLLVSLVAFVPELQPIQVAGESAEQAQSIRYDKINGAADGVTFLAQFGWEVDPAPVEESSISIPTEFDKVFAAYNELQRTQGLDLSAHAGRTVQRYTYRVTNYEGYEGTVLANLLVSRGRVIGGDVCSAEQNGFLHGFERRT